MTISKIEFGHIDKFDRTELQTVSKIQYLAPMF